MQKILTVPGVEERGEPYLLTGNHYVSLPHIAKDGTVQTVSFLSGELRALLEYKGDLTPFVRADGTPVTVNDAAYTDDFIPTFSGEGGGLEFSLSYIAPEALHGVCCKLRIHAKCDVKLEAGFCVTVDQVERAVFHSAKMEGRIHAFHDTWTNTLVCELLCGKSYGGFGVCGDGAEILASESGGTVITAVQLHAGEDKELLFYISAAAETDGIGLAAMDMRRRGGAPACAHERLLSQRHIALPDAVLEKYANFNQNFCYYFSCGYTLDTDELCLVTSKSTAYYVSAAFWSRDAFLWAFPTILRISPAMAREWLTCAFKKYARRIGIHALYTDGTVLYPGFELDEQVAPVIALKSYIEHTDDYAFLESDMVKAALNTIKQELMTHYDADVGLFSTELDASDDPVTYSFVTYDNALCCAALDFLGETALAASVKRALYENCVTECKGKRVFAYAAEGDERLLYDDPPGSLALLPFYGVCERDDELWENTFAYIYSDENPYFYASGELMGAGCEHTPYPWAASLVNHILGRGYAEKKVLRAMVKTAASYPIACESFSLSDGALNTGDAFATMAGFLANGIFRAFEK